MLLGIQSKRPPFPTFTAPDLLLTPPHLTPTTKHPLSQTPSLAPGLYSSANNHCCRLSCPQGLYHADGILPVAGYLQAVARSMQDVPWSTRILREPTVRLCLHACTHGRSHPSTSKHGGTLGEQTRTQMYAMMHTQTYTDTDTYQIYAHAHTHTHIHMCSHAHAHAHPRTHTHMLTVTHTHMLMGTHKHAHIHTRKQVCTLPFMLAHAHIRPPIICIV